MNFPQGIRKPTASHNIQGVKVEMPQEKLVKIKDMVVTQG
jgi:hypothetical protein